MSEGEVKTVKSGSRIVYVVLITTAVVLSVATYFFLSQANRKEFESEFHSYARETADLAENNAANTFQQLQSLASAITSVAIDEYQKPNEGSWPNVTIPHWEQRVQQISESAGMELIMFDEVVEEDFEMTGQHEGHLPTQQHDHHHSYEPGEILYIHNCSHSPNDTRHGYVDEDFFMERILEKYGYHGYGLATPVYQFGPVENVNGNIALMDLMTHQVFKKELVASIEYNVPVISEYLDVSWLAKQDHHEPSSEHDHHGRRLGHGLESGGGSIHSFVLEPVKESFDPNAKTIGFVVGIVTWGTFFHNVLKSPLAVDMDEHTTHAGVNGIVVKVVSDCGTTLTYVLNSDKEDESMEGDWKEKYERYEQMNHTAPFFWKDHPKGESRHCHFDLQIYPSEEFHATYQTNTAVLYAGIVAAIFIFTAIIFSCYDRFIFKRQQEVVTKATKMVIENARQAALNERELNDFVAHEVRNPLAAAMSACSFVSSAIVEQEQQQSLIDLEEQRKDIKDDLHIIDSSLHFINDLLRNMLDMQRAGTNQMKIEYKPCQILDDVLRPVQSMLHVRGTSFEVQVDCPPDLIVMTDSLRLKQIILNLSRNSAKFVEKGFVRLTARVKHGHIELLVDDSGPGIPLEKQKVLFGKFQESLDSLHQGTGIGLSLCKKLTEMMGGSVYIDKEYHSGMEGRPGTRFVVELAAPPLDLDDLILQKYSSHSVNGLSKPSPAAPPVNTVETQPKSTPPVDNTTVPPPPPPTPWPSHLPKRPSSGNLLVAHDDCSANESIAMMSSAALNDTTDGLAPLNDAINNGSSILSMHSSGTSLTSRNHSSSRSLSGHGSIGSLADFLASDLNDDVEDNDPEAIKQLPENLSVLFTDDDMVLRKLFSRTLKKLSPTWKIQEASNGETAIEICAEKKESGEMFDLIFMDQYMASVQKQLLGTETVRSLRAHGVDSATICGLSANDVENDFLSAGADAFMFKPFPCKPDLLRVELLKILNAGRKARK
ncbi:MAG: hypothetical protein SGARI_000061 [Bacillariaceae sp.]